MAIKDQQLDTSIVPQIDFLNKYAEINYAVSLN